MSVITLEDQGTVAVLRLANKTTNAINGQLVHDLYQALNVVSNQYKGLVLAGGEKFFSIGLDLPELLQLNQSEMDEFWHAFNHLAYDLFTLPLPTVCALSGHAVAGGNVLALTCDYRLGGSEKNKSV